MKGRGVLDIKSALLGELNVIQVAASTNAEQTTRVYERMAGITRFLYENLPSYEIAGYVVFLLVFVLSAIVYKLGFAKKVKAISKYCHLCVPICGMYYVDIFRVIPTYD